VAGWEGKGEVGECVDEGDSGKGVGKRQRKNVCRMGRFMYLFTNAKSSS